LQENVTQLSINSKNIMILCDWCVVGTRLLSRGTKHFYKVSQK